MSGRDSGAVVATRYGRRLADDRVECTLCPHLCRLRESERGRCGVRARRNGGIVLTAYGRVNGFRVDPIERKGLYHFLPGAPTLVFGSAGWNLARSASAPGATAAERVRNDLPIHPTAPEEIARVALDLDCPVVALGSNEPAVVHEYAVDVARACRDLGLKTVAVTAGYVQPAPRAEFYRHVDAASVALMAFTDRFYRRHRGARLAPVLDTLVHLKREAGVWVELTVPLVRGENDSADELGRLTRWVVDELGPDVPIHFEAERPGWARPGDPPPQAAMLARARAIARANGVRYAYADEWRIAGDRGTSCHRCGERLVGREWYVITVWRLTEDGRCRRCGAPCAGVFERGPGVPGDWPGRVSFVDLARPTTPG